MVEWIALIVSVIGLILNIIVMREKLATALDDYRKRQQEKKSIKKAKKFINKLALLDASTRQSYKLMFVIYIFLISAISSAILGLVAKTTQEIYTLILYGSVIFVFTYSIFVLLLLILINSFDFGSYLMFIFLSFALGIPWAAVGVGLNLVTGFPLVIAGLFSALTHFVSNYILVTKIIRQR